MSILVESLKRLYTENKISKAVVDRIYKGKGVTEAEYMEITSK